MEIIHPLAEQYAITMSSSHQSLMEEVMQYTQAYHQHAHMISNAVQAHFLSFLSMIKKPNYILEIGTFTGYSALALAEGLSAEGALHTIEIREKDASTAQSFFDKSPKAKQIHLHLGNALDIIPTLPYTWDMVFIDADKINYINYYQMVYERLHPNGIIIVDNVLFHGQVLTSPIKGKNAKAIHSFNQFIAADTTVKQVLLTVRDGLLLIQKK